MISIPLTRGKFALIDNTDYPLISRHRWAADKRGNTWYAVTGVRRVKGKGASKGGTRIILMHRLILNAPEGTEVDHINGNGLDNRRENIRLSTKSQQQANLHHPNIGRSGYRGVWKSGKKWVAYIKYGGKRIRLGLFNNPEDASAAYREALVEARGEYAGGKFSLPQVRQI